MPRRAPGETGLINMIRRTVATRGHVALGIGDDACLLRDGTVLTTDAYVEGVHFDPAYMTFRSIGRRCACAAISDVVAMAAEPRLLLVALALPATLTARHVRSLYRGIEDACAALDCEVAGGDIIRSDRLLLALTATGNCRHPRLRSAARPGDKVYVTGKLGLAETGRLALARGLSRRAYRRAIKRHLYPMPRIAVMRRLSPRMRALIDTSDGLATDARHIAEASGVKLVLERALVPMSPETMHLCRATDVDPCDFILSAGEDYELLFTSRARIDETVKDVPVTRIGRVERGTGLHVAGPDGRTRPLRLHGYDHLRNRGEPC